MCAYMRVPQNVGRTATRVPLLIGKVGRWQHALGVSPLLCAVLGRAVLTAGETRETVDMMAGLAVLVEQYLGKQSRAAVRSIRKGRAKIMHTCTPVFNAALTTLWSCAPTGFNINACHAC